MSRYRGPRIRIVRRLGELRGLTKKMTVRTKPPGQHDTKPGASSEYVIQLKEKQKIKYNYANLILLVISAFGLPTSHSHEMIPKILNLLNKPSVIK